MVGLGHVIRGRRNGDKEIPLTVVLMYLRNVIDRKRDVEREFSKGSA